MVAVPFGILFAGFAFTIFTIPFAGVDLLIDAVGFLLIFNGLLPLRKLHSAFFAAVPVSICLVILASLQLFSSSAILFGLHQVAEAALLVTLVWGLRALLHQSHRAVTAVFSVIIPVATAITGLLQLPGIFHFWQQPILLPKLIFGLQLMLLSLLFLLCIRPPTVKPATR